MFTNKPRKGRKPLLHNAQLLSVYLDDVTTNKLDLIAQQTLVSKSAIARDILTKQLLEIENITTKKPHNLLCS